MARMARRTRMAKMPRAAEVPITTYIDVLAMGISALGLGVLIYIIVPLWQALFLVGGILVIVGALGAYLNDPRRK